jgi:hypothetical protein
MLGLLVLATTRAFGIHLSANRACSRQPRRTSIEQKDESRREQKDCQLVRAGQDRCIGRESNPGLAESPEI